MSSGVARTPKNILTLKGDYWMGQWFSSIAPLFEMGTSIKGKNRTSIKEKNLGANSFLEEQFLMVCKIIFTTLGDLP